jgi:hypothetical protein
LEFPISNCTTNIRLSIRSHKYFFWIVFIMDRRSCPDCGKGIKSLSGLSRHRIRCLVLLGQRKIVVPKIYQHSPASQSSIESTKDSPESQISHALQLPSCKPRGNLELEYEEWIDINDCHSTNLHAGFLTIRRMAIRKPYGLAIWFTPYMVIWFRMAIRSFRNSLRQP